MSKFIIEAILLFIIAESTFGSQISKNTQDIISQPSTAHILGRVVKENGSPISNLAVTATSDEGEPITAQTDASGHFDLNVYARTWWIKVDPIALDDIHFIQPMPLIYTVENNTTNSGADILVQSITGAIVGRVYDTNDTGLASLQMSCETVISNSVYRVGATTDSNGNYRFNVCDGSWTVIPLGIDSLGYQNLPSQQTTVMNSTNFIDFIAFPLPTLELTTSQIPNALVGIPYSFQFEATGGAPPYLWMLSSGSLPAGLDFSYDGGIVGTPTEATKSVFTVTLFDYQGLIINKEFFLSSAYPFSFTMIQQTAPQELILQLNGETNRSYILEYSTQLLGTNWIPLLTNKAIGGVTLFTNVNTFDSMRIYRARQF